MKFLFAFLSSLLVLGMLAACGSAPESGPAEAVSAYHQALVDKDADRLATLSCAVWEAQAMNELASFGAVEATLEDLACQVAGEAEGYTLVNCSGVIRANYGAEVLEIDLSGRTYQAAFEGGEWRMCGYPGYR